MSEILKIFSGDFVKLCYFFMNSIQKVRWKMSETDELCEYCKYFDAGKCRRYPPKVFMIGEAWNAKPTQFFPKVNHDEYCGEFKPKKSSNVVSN